MSRWTLLSLLALAGSLALVAWTGDADAPDLANVQENADTPAGPLDAVHTIGQSFKFHYPNLDAVEVRWIVSPDLQFADGSRIVFHLRHREDDEADLASAYIALGDLKNDATTRFSFSPIRNSQDQTFYFFLDTSEADLRQGSLSVWASADGGSVDGQMDLNGVPAPRVLTLRAYYQPDLLLLAPELWSAVGRYLATLLCALVLILSPGLALLRLAKIADDRDPVERTAWAAGLGTAALSCGSILLLFAGASIRWLEAAIAAALIASLVAAAAAFFRRNHRPRPPRPRVGLASGSLAGLAVLSLAVGLLQIRSTPVPLWKDSPIHADTISSILARGTLPTGSFYHYGYHTLVALVAQLSGANVPSAMLVVGQLLITIAGLSLFLLTRRLTGSPIAGLVSAVCVWFLSPTPAYFITWGRYPLLLGAALLPVALWSIVHLVDQPRLEPRSFALVVIVFWGLAFAQIRLGALALVFAAIYLAGRIGRTHPSRAWLTRGALAVAAGSFLGVIWLVRLFQRGLLGDLLPQNALDYALDLPTAVAVSLSQHGPALLAFAGLGLVAVLVRKRRGPLVLLLWFAVLCGVSLLPVVGEKYVPAALLVLLGFIPVSALVGELAALAYEKAAPPSNRAAAVGILALWLFSFLGARDIVSIVNPTTMLFTEADRHAMAFIETHTPADALFLVNSAAWFGPYAQRTDGGAWIPLLTGRPETFIYTLPLSSQSGEAAPRLIADQHVAYIYLGTRSGALNKLDFACQPDRYAPVYDQEGVTIYQVLAAPDSRLAPRAPCAASR